MSLIKPLSQLEQDIAAMREDVLTVAEATHHLAATLKNRNERFWSQPVDQILAALNDDVPTSMGILSTNFSIGTVVNASLDALNLPQFPTRAPTTTRSDIKLEANGTFVLVPEPPATSAE